MLKKIYFPNLNGIRFIAALLVMITHIEQIKSMFGLPNYWDGNRNDFVDIVGKLGVILFFVLSGFLITYLLLVEKKETGTIGIKDFYIRRILRIWPLYYLVFFLSFFILPKFDLFILPDITYTVEGDFFVAKALLFLLFLPNLARVLFATVPYAGQAWSVGVEEQFYLSWPVLLKKFQNTFSMLVGVILFYLIVKFGLIISQKIYPSNTFIDLFLKFWVSFNIDCMAIGGIFAHLLHTKKERLLNMLFNRYVQISVYLVTISLLGLGVRIPLIHYELYGLLFAVIILNLAGNKNSVLSIENAMFDYLGKVSYGLYMLHAIAIVFVVKACVYLEITNNIFLYTACILATILLSALSYEFFEKYFLKKKINYSKLISGDSAK